MSVTINNKKQHMKLTITKPDILKLINEKFNLDLTLDELDIVNAVSTYEIALRKTMKQFPGTHEKISAIKRFRELMAEVKTGGDYVIGIGLGEAKFAVENMEMAIDKHALTGKIPNN